VTLELVALEVVTLEEELFSPMNSSSDNKFDVISKQPWLHCKPQSFYEMSMFWGRLPTFIPADLFDAHFLPQPRHPNRVVISLRCRQPCT
jgi:hypothetical protein